MKNLAIPEAGPADEAAVLHVVAEAFAPYRAGYTPGAWVDIVLTPATLRARMKEVTVLLAVDDSGRVTGTVASRWNPEGKGTFGAWRCCRNRTARVWRKRCWPA